MISHSEAANVTYHGAGWCAALAAECAAAQHSIHMSALSMHAPTPHAHGAWPDLWSALTAAAARGVAVHIWLSAPSTIHPATRGNITAGRAAAARGVVPHFVTGTNLLHAKTAVIDARAVWVGSGNFTSAAAHHNHEAYLRADCPRIAAELIHRWQSLA